jgi:hypothetical protein
VGFIMDEKNSNYYKCNLGKLKFSVDMAHAILLAVSPRIRYTELRTSCREARFVTQNGRGILSRGGVCIGGESPDRIAQSLP